MRAIQIKEEKFINLKALAYYPDYREITINGVRVESGFPHRVDLAMGEKVIKIVVTARDYTTKNYTLTVTRE